MNCFIKDKKTFKTLCVCPVMDYDLVIWSIYDEVSTIIISKKKEQLFEDGDVVCFGNYIGIIKESTVGNCTAELKCEHVVKMFSRDVVFTSGPSTTVEAFLAKQINTNYTQQADILYRLPYINVSVLTQTESTMKPDVEDGVWNIKSYIAKARRIQNIFTEFSATKNTLDITISSKNNGIKQIDFSDPLIRIEEETYSNSSVGKITSICQENGAVQNWYLLDDGTIVSNYQERNRTQGDWITINVSKAEDVYYDVRDEFAKNSFSHKILFSTPKSKARFTFYDKLKIATGNRLYYSYISAIRIKKNADRVEYQCGELRTSFTDKIQEEM